MKKIYLSFIILSLLSCGSNIPNLLKEADIFEKSGQTEKAIEMYSRVLAENPRNLEALLSRAFLYSSLKRYSFSGSDFNAAAAIEETTDKTEAGKDYYLAGGDFTLGGLCTLASTAFKKSCDLGTSQACTATCTK